MKFFLDSSSRIGYIDCMPTSKSKIRIRQSKPASGVGIQNRRASFSTIYCINFPNGFSYVGQTTRAPYRRIAKHIEDAEKGSCLYVHVAIRKHHEKGITWNILWQGNCLRSELNRKEIYFIKILQSYHTKGYNMNEGPGTKSERRQKRKRKRGEKRRRKQQKKKAIQLHEYPDLDVAYPKIKKAIATNCWSR